MEQMQRRRPFARPAVAYVLAMLYLMLFTVLAIGFCAASTMSIQIARNDRSAADAQAAAESGMQLVRYHLSQLSIPSDTPDGRFLQTIADALGHELSGTAALNGHDLTTDKETIYFPSATEWSSLDDSTGTRFQAQITTTGQTVFVKVIGRGKDESIAHAIQMQFKRTVKSDASDKLVADSASYEEVSP